MKLRLALLLGFLATAAFSPALAGAVRLLEVDGRHPDSAAPAIVAGELVTLRLLLPEDARRENIQARLLQVAADAVQIPLQPLVSLSPDPADPRLTLARFVAPPLLRIASLALELSPHGSVSLVLFPSGLPRADLPPLSAALSLAQARLAVAGASGELRAYLRAEKVDFADLGPATPEKLEPGVLLLAELSQEDWTRLAASDAPAGADLLGFVSDPTLLAGVYATPSAGRMKITLPILPRLENDPRARATLHALLRQMLPATPTTDPSLDR